MKTTKAITLFCLVVVSMTITPPAYAEDGNRLLPSCKMLIRILDSEPIPKNSNRLQMGLDAGYCNGIMIGVVGTMISYKSHEGTGLLKDTSPSNRFLFGCFPDVAEIDTEQLARVMVKYLEEHTEDLHDPSPVLIKRAFIETFPCK